MPSGDILMTTGVYDDPRERTDCVPLPAAAQGGRGEDPRHLADARHARHRIARRRDHERLPARCGRCRGCGGRSANGIPSCTPSRWRPCRSSTRAYLGVAEKAREIALGLAARRKDDPLTAVTAGELENQIVTAQIAHEAMVSLTAAAKPGPETTSAMMCRRTIFGNAILRAGEKALELGGGAGFYRSAGTRAVLPRPAGRPLSSAAGERADVPDRTGAARPAVRRVRTLERA